MYTEVLEFIRRQGIRSFQEVRLLLFLWQHPEFTGTYQQFCECLYLGDCPLVEQMINRLHERGLIESCEGCYKLADQTELKTSLARLAQAFEQPLTRQQLLAGMNNRYS